MADLNVYTAINDYRKARRKAMLQILMARITGQSVDLLSYDEVLSKLHLTGQTDRGLKEIKLEDVVGSVGKYQDFTRQFLPRREGDEYRWARLKSNMEMGQGLPPIDVYQIGEVYFVRDGNRRVSIAREMGLETIEAYVTEVLTRVPMDRDLSTHEFILRSERAEFLKETNLDKLLPMEDIRVTELGMYDRLREHIEVHKYYMGIDQHREVTYAEAVQHWYDHVYAPVVRLIRRHGILRDFPSRTETDLYLWFLEFREQIKDEVGWKSSDSRAILGFRSLIEPKAEYLLDQQEKENRDLLQGQQNTSPIGTWREEHQDAFTEEQISLFQHILLPFVDRETGWRSLEQAILVAKRENADLIGLHVRPEGETKDNEPEADFLQAFEQRCSEQGVRSSFRMETGSIDGQIVKYARWSDLLILDAVHSPGNDPLSRMRSRVRSVIRRIGLPLLAVKGAKSDLQRALIAYDGSPAANEALYLAAYLSNAWGIELNLVTVETTGLDVARCQANARRYFQEMGLNVRMHIEEGNVAGNLIRLSRQIECDHIIMGSFSESSIINVLLGSVVDAVLRGVEVPVMICR